MIRDDLERRVKIAGYDLVGSYEAGIPIYKTRVKMQVEKKQVIPAIARVALRLVDQGLNTIPLIAEALGVEGEFVEQAIEFLNVNLLVSSRLAQPGNSLIFSVTSQGKMAIQEALRSLSVIHIDVQVDGLTGEVGEVTEETLLRGDDLKKSDGWPLHATPGARPTVETLNSNIRLLNDTLKDELDADSAGEKIIQALEVENPWLAYKPINMLIFRHRLNGQLLLRAFDGHEQVQKYDERLTERERKSGRVIPDSIMVPASEGGTFSPIVEQVKPEIDKLEELDRKIKDVAAEKQELETQNQKPEPSSQVVTERTRKIKALESELDALQKILAGNRVVQSNEHRQVLIDALGNAQQIVIIVSPWISRDATDQEILKLMREAIQRGVWVVIGYGMPRRPDRQDRASIAPFVEAEFKSIQKLKNGDKFIFQNWAGTHEKVLVCDDRLSVISSFNWLSYKGGQGFRREMGALFVDPSIVKDVRRRTLENFKNLPDELLKLH